MPEKDKNLLDVVGIKPGRLPSIGRQLSHSQVFLSKEWALASSITTCTQVVAKDIARLQNQTRVSKHHKQSLYPSHHDLSGYNLSLDDNPLLNCSSKNRERPCPIDLFSLLQLKRSSRVIGLCYVVVKVALLLVIEILAFPVICGWWLDICSLSLFDATLKVRLSFWLPID